MATRIESGGVREPKDIESIALKVVIPGRYRQALIRQAIIRGFRRVDPGKRWTEREYREAMRYAVTEIAVATCRG